MANYNDPPTAAEQADWAVCAPPECPECGVAEVDLDIIDAAIAVDTLWGYNDSTPEKLHSGLLKLRQAVEAKRSANLPDRPEGE